MFNCSQRSTIFFFFNEVLVNLQQVSSLVHASRKQTFSKPHQSCISLANKRLMDVIQLPWTAVGWPNGEKLASTSVISTEESVSHRKSTQVQAKPKQTEWQIDQSYQLPSICKSI